MTQCCSAGSKQADLQSVQLCLMCSQTVAEGQQPDGHGTLCGNVGNILCVV